MIRVRSYTRTTCLWGLLLLYPHFSFAALLFKSFMILLDQNHKVVVTALNRAKTEVKGMMLQLSEACYRPLKYTLKFHPRHYFP